jgi:multiple sugar transport system substrate-binding protein
VDFGQRRILYAHFLVAVLTVLALTLVFGGARLRKSARRSGSAVASGTVLNLLHDKGALPGFDQWFVDFGKLTQTAVGVRLVPHSTNSTDSFIAQIHADLVSPEMTSLFTWWSTYRAEELVNDDLVLDMTSLWDAHSSEYPAALRQAFSIDGRTYGWPYIIEYYPVWYSKKLFDRLGLAEPRNWEEFIRLCEDLKAAGVTPILSSLQGGWPSFIWFEEMIIGEDPDLYVDLCEGRARYTDPRVRKALDVWGDMIARGYFTDPATRMITDGGHLWNTEQFGMVLIGSWYWGSVLVSQGVPPEDIRAFILPSHNPEAGNNIIFESLPIFAAKNSKNLDAVLAVADWWMGAEGNGQFARLAGSLPANSKSDVSHLPPVKEMLASEIRSGDYRLLNRYWEATPTPICEYAVEKMADFILEPATATEILTQIDSFAQIYWDDQKQH